MVGSKLNWVGCYYKCERDKMSETRGVFGSCLDDVAASYLLDSNLLLTETWAHEWQT